MPVKLLPVLLGLLLSSVFAWAQSTPVALADNSQVATGSSAAAAATAPAEAAAGLPTIYHVADEMPAFPGGPEAFQKFLRKELRYPEEALRHGVSGRVVVRFLITHEGRIRDAEVVKGLGRGLDQEALRLVRIMPWWTPGRVAGQPVWMSYTLPIIFRGLD